MTAVSTAEVYTYPAGELLPKMSLTKSKRNPAPAAGILHSHHVARGSSGAFIPVSPASKGIPVVGNGDGKRRFLTKDEVVVPDTLQNPASKRALSCGNANYGADFAARRATVVTRDTGVAVLENAARIPTTASRWMGSRDAAQSVRLAAQRAPSALMLDTSIVPTRTSVAVLPGDTCSRDANGKASCQGSSSNSLTITTTQAAQQATTTTTTPAAATTTTTTPAAAATTTPTPKAATTTTTPAQQSTTTSTAGQEIPTTASVAVESLNGGVPTTMYNPTAITTLPNAASASSASASADIPVGSPSGAMAVTAGVGYSILVTAVSFALGHVLVMA
ncbi:hypothetical protein FRB90_006542 [Tulasnella sp. 427]|nr:hypothetical protein FRB90_006542 [Tulasnella sp. 427]